jgi:hypothetical protein
MASVSGLNSDQRGRAQARAAQAATLCLPIRDKVHYTMGDRRWEGIEKRRISRLGEFPAYSDCSSFATWCLWNALAVGYGLDDIVNGHNWKAGYTGTMREHGWRVRDVENVRRGDCVFYANPSHVTIVVGRKADGTLMVVSHGIEAGPFYVRYDYRQPTQIRRYI